MTTAKWASVSIKGPPVKGRITQIAKNLCLSKNRCCAYQPKLYSSSISSSFFPLLTFKLCSSSCLLPFFQQPSLFPFFILPLRACGERHLSSHWFFSPSPSDSLSCVPFLLQPAPSVLFLSPRVAFNSCKSTSQRVSLITWDIYE